MTDPNPKKLVYAQFAALVKDISAEKEADAWQLLAVTAVQALLDLQATAVTIAAAVAALAEKTGDHQRSVEELIAAVDELRTGEAPEGEPPG